MSGEITGKAPTSPFTRIAAAEDNLLRAASRVGALADTLVGSLPACAGKQEGNPSATGVFGALDSSANSIVASVDRIHEACERIERSLP